MKQSRIEIKSIEAELRSIRADTKSSRLVSLLEADSPPDQPLMQESPYQSHQVAQLYSPLAASTTASTIAPTIVRQPSEQKRTPVGLSSQGASAPPKREIQCFPISNQVSQSQSSTISQAQLSSVIEQLRQSSPEGKSKKTGRYSASSRQQAIRQLVEAKAKQINDLSTQQETAILELMDLSGQLNPGDQETDADFRLQNEFNVECEVAEIPYVERDRNGILVLTNRSIDQAKTPAKAETERVAAKATKSSRSRHRNSRNGIHLVEHIWRWIWKPIVWVGSASVNAIGATHSGEHTARRKGYRGSGRRAITSAPEMPVTLKEAAILVVGSALLRISLDWVVMSYPLLWIPSILVMIAPAAFAIYRSTVKPPAGFAWGYRLFAILIGLLLGGRL
ncbi:MAG: hypothetical protein HC827_06195 [Cyanobacteria bacterium RM1_2_2]|nr:hypothetical protein [Cyanobacteria bacterium RM1_2_2]